MLMFFIMLFVRLYFAYKNGTESFGMGDVLLIAGTGVWFPTPEIACSIVFIAVIGGIIFFTLGGLNKQKKYIPFGPLWRNVCLLTRTGNIILRIKSNEKDR